MIIELCIEGFFSIIRVGSSAMMTLRGVVHSNYSLIHGHTYIHVCIPQGLEMTF